MILMKLIVEITDLDGPDPLRLSSMMDDKPNCWRCRHFQITHHKSFPYGCLVMGFKSRQLPCLEVLSVDGVPCKRFEIKPHLKSR